MRKIKALGLLSLGLDSMLAYRVMKDLGAQVLPVYIDMGFSGDDINRFLYKNDSRDHYYKNLIIFDAFDRFKKILIKPEHGYGKNLNPCIDCKVMMLRIAKEIMDENNLDIIITGEVKGQRLMSQTSRNLSIIEREACVEGLVLRPLSAKIFDPLIIEKKGLIDRNRLFGFSGRSRKPQYALAKSLNINEFPSPSGGCLLTYKGFSEKVRSLLDFYEINEINREKIALLKIGRHFFVGNLMYMIMGKNYSENLLLKKIKSAHIAMYPADEKGPYAIIYNKGGKYYKTALNECRSIIQKYSGNNAYIIENPVV